MKISTEIGSIVRKVGEKKAVELCAQAGFDAWDFSMFDMGKSSRCITSYEQKHTSRGSLWYNQVEQKL